MTLPDVNVGQPHVESHNNERHAINDLQVIATSLQSELDGEEAARAAADVALQAAIDALESAPSMMFMPSSFGAVGDGVADDTTALQDTLDAAAGNGGTVLLGLGKTYRITSTLRPASGVTITTLATTTKWAGGSYAARIIAADGWTAGFMIELDAVNSVSISGVGLIGNVSSTNQVSVGGIEIKSTCDWCTVESCSISAMSIGAIKCSGRACKIATNGLQNFWQYRGALTADEAVLYVSGTDNWVENNQANAGMGLTDTVDGVNFHKCAVLVESQTSWFIGGNGEFAECAWKVKGVNNVFSAVRGDTNPGVGMYLTSTAYSNKFSDTIFQSCCLKADDTYNLITVDGVANVFDGILVGYDYTGSGNRPMYVIMDKLTLGPNGHFNSQSLNVYEKIQIDDATVSRDIFAHVAGLMYGSFRPGGFGDPSLRYASRQAVGKMFYDSVANKPTFSSGDRWRDASGNPLGNLLPASFALGIDGLLHWDPYAATCTVARSKGLLQANWHRANVVEVTTTATGVTNGFAAALLKSTDAITVGIVAGQSYQAQIEAKGAAGRSGNAVTVTINWLDASNAVISSSTAINAVALSATDPTGLVSGTVTAPTGAVAALLGVTFVATGLATNDKFYFINAGLTPGTGSTSPQES